MSSHIGVSCDACLKTNFSTRRYKCLICDNYDLCGSCYDINAESQNHLHTHPMQCLLTKTAYEIFYSGESIPHRTIVSLTCPYCALTGFLPQTLLSHCYEKHSDNRTSQMCPICVINPIQGHQIRFVSLADHIARDHDQGDTLMNSKEDFEHDEDEDEGLPLYVLAERLFLKEENRRQRLAQTLTRTERRVLPRQSNTRGSRGNSRGHPYGTLPRTTTGSFRIPFDPTDPYGSILFSQDPLFGIDYDAPFPDSINQTPFFLTSSIPSTESIINEQKKSNSLQNKQKRSNPTFFIEPSISEYSLWQQNIPPSLPTTTTTTTTTSNPSNVDKPIENKNENDSRSLLGKLLKSDSKLHSIHNDDHSAFIHSLLFSSFDKQTLS